MTAPADRSAILRSPLPGGGMHYALESDIGQPDVSRLLTAMVADLTAGERCFVLSLEHAGTIHLSLWGKLVDFTLKCEQTPDANGSPSRFSFEGVHDVRHRAAIETSRMNRLYAVSAGAGETPSAMPRLNL